MNTIRRAAGLAVALLLAAVAVTACGEQTPGAGADEPPLAHPAVLAWKRVG